MSTHSKISDVEMNYFQFKAKQILQKRKEDNEWQEYCKKNFLKCAACLAEDEISSKNSKDVGIQTAPKKNSIAATSPLNKISLQSSLFPGALKNIKEKLEKIDLTLSEFYNPKESEGKFLKRPVDPPSHPSLYKSNDRKRELIQASLKTSLEKLHSSSIVQPKKQLSAPLRSANSSYFLPHDLQKKREIARKNYLASLQKPQLKSGTTKSCIKKKTELTTQNKKNSKSIKRKPVKHKKTASKEEETLVKSTEADQVEDKNIEKLVDGILCDLIGETVLDFNRIKERKREWQSSISKPNAEQSTFPLPLNPAEKSAEFPENSSTQKLKSFFCSNRKLQQDTQEKNLKDKLKLHFKDDAADALNHTSKQESFKINEILDLYRQFKPPKFLCTTAQTIEIEPLQRTKIEDNQKRFWKYLEDSSWSKRGNLNPWSICNMVAESVLDDCIQDIADELSELPKVLIEELYNQEFINHVGT